MLLFPLLVAAVAVGLLIAITTLQSFFDCLPFVIPFVYTFLLSLSLSLLLLSCVSIIQEERQKENKQVDLQTIAYDEEGEGEGEGGKALQNDQCRTSGNSKKKNQTFPKERELQIPNRKRTRKQILLREEREGRGERVHCRMAMRRRSEVNKRGFEVLSPSDSARWRTRGLVC